MLVLGRRMDERVILRVGDVVVRVTVSDIRGNKVRLGFEMPDWVTCDREEVDVGKRAGKKGGRP